CAVYCLAPVWVSASRAPSSPGSGPSTAASADWAAVASSPAARSSAAAWLAACQLVPVPITSTRRPRSLSATAAAGATSSKIAPSASACPSIVRRIMLVCAAGIRAAFLIAVSFIFPVPRGHLSGLLPVIDPDAVEVRQRHVHGDPGVVYQPIEPS